MIALLLEISVKITFVRSHACYAERESISFKDLNIFLLKMLLSKYCLLVKLPKTLFNQDL